MEYNEKKNEIVMLSGKCYFSLSLFVLVDAVLRVGLSLIFLEAPSLSSEVQHVVVDFAH